MIYRGFTVQIRIFRMGKRGGSSKTTRSPPRYLYNSSSGDFSPGRKLYGGNQFLNKTTLFHGPKNDSSQFGVTKGSYGGKSHIFYYKHVRLIGLVLGFMGFIFLFDSLMFSIICSVFIQNGLPGKKLSGLQDEGSGYATEQKTTLNDEEKAYVNEQKTPVILYGQLLGLASNSLAQKEFKQDSYKPWEEPHKKASAWKPCADKPDPIPEERPPKTTGFILVSANGGLNQQRVAVCNAVVITSLLNATLVLPKFLYSNVWNDPSQFGDIYQEEYFMNLLKDEVNIVKELPSHLQSIDIEALGSQLTDSDISKEAKPIDFVKIALPLLQRHGVAHFLGFGNRLGFDPLPFKLQKLRCKCNFHALKFVPKIQLAGSILVRRMRKFDGARSQLDKQLLGGFMPDISSKGHDSSRDTSRYLALHLRFEIDMVSYSMCDFGGGEMERKELQAYRESHFPILVERLKSTGSISPAQLRKLGRCPLTPEEAGLVLSSLGFRRGIYIYLAGSQIYGGKSRMHPFTGLFPNVVTKEDLLTSSELAPFRNFSSQMAALDFIACATADVFAMTDSGSQLSSLVSGFRIYYGGGHAPTLRPNKKRLAAILSENGTIRWNSFESRVRKMIEEGQRVHTRGVGKSIYRQPRSPECMCKGN